MVKLLLAEGYIDSFGKLVGARSTASATVGASQCICHRACIASFDESRDAGGVAGATAEKLYFAEFSVFVYFEIYAA